MWDASYEKDEKALKAHFSGRTGSVVKKGNEYFVPLKYDKKTGAVIARGSPNLRAHLKRLNLNDWRFLEAWRRYDWNPEKAREELGLSETRAKHLVRSLKVFQQEEARDKALATIPTTAYIQARHVENVLKADNLDDSQRDSLKELAKISGAYKNTAITLQQNFFTKPDLSPEQEKATREFFDTIATQSESA